NIRCIVIAASLCRSIAGEVFSTCYHARRSEARSLESTHLGASHCGAEIGVLSGTFLNAAPPCVASDVHHRCECPADSGAARLSRREGLGLLLHRGIPRRRHAERRRKQRVITMDHVEPKKERDVQPTPLDGEMLQPADL